MGMAAHIFRTCHTKFLDAAWFGHALYDFANFFDFGLGALYPLFSARYQALVSVIRLPEDKHTLVLSMAAELPFGLSYRLQRLPAG